MFVSGRGTYELAVRGLDHCCWKVTRGNVRESVAIAVIGHEWGVTVRADPILLVYQSNFSSLCCHVGQFLYLIHFQFPNAIQPPT